MLPSLFLECEIIIHLSSFDKKKTLEEETCSFDRQSDVIGERIRPERHFIIRMRAKVDGSRCAFSKKKKEKKREKNRAL